MIVNACDIVLKLNNCVARERCTLCDADGRATSPFDWFIDGTWQWVCPACVDHACGLPSLHEIRDKANQFVELAREAKRPQERVCIHCRCRLVAVDADEHVRLCPPCIAAVERGLELGFAQHPEQRGNRGEKS